MGRIALLANIIVFLVIADLGGKEPPPCLTQLEVKEFIAKRIESHGRAVFVSRSGEMMGMDSDSIISFEADGKLVLEEFGFVHKGYGGKYNVSKHGTLIPDLDNYGHDWPFMRLYKQNTDYFLAPAFQSENRFIFGNRGGSVTSSEFPSFWPFKLTEKKTEPHISKPTDHLQIAHFAAPKIPHDFKWVEKQIELSFDLVISNTGQTSIKKAQTSEVQEPDSNGDISLVTKEIDQSDWRFAIVQAFEKAAAAWRLYPMEHDGKKYADQNQSVYLTIEKLANGRIHILQDGPSYFGYDNMPLRTRNLVSRQNQETRLAIEESEDEEGSR